MGFLNKWLATQITYMGTFSRVNSWVNFKILLCCKWLVAYRTFKCSFSGMKFHVVCQPGTWFEPFITSFTTVGCVIWVNYHMQRNLIIAFKRLVAFCTHKRSFFTMYSGMFYQAAFIWKALTAVWTFKSFCFLHPFLHHYH